MPKIEIEGIVAKNEEKVFGFIDIGTTSVNLYRIPIIIVNGKSEGKTLCLLGGTHGTEVAGTEAIIRIIKNIDPKRMKGSILAVPVVNGPQFEHHTAYISPIDQLNQNRVFPGDSRGTLSRRTAYIIFSKIISKADALCDCHGGDISEQIIGWVNAMKGKDEKINSIAREMAACFPCKVIFSRIASNSRMTGVAQEKFGIPCILPESSAPHQTTRELERYIKFNYDGINNLLKYFQIIEGAPSMFNAIIDPEEYNLVAERGGIWHSNVEAGQIVERGIELGNITDLFGNILEIFKAPKKSFIKTVRMWYSVNCGDKVIEAALI